AAHKQSAHFKAIAILFSSASVVGGIAFVSFGFVAPQPIEAGVLEKPPTPAEELGSKVEIKILEGASVEGAPAYDPAEITVEKGTFIVWTNGDPVIHSVTSGIDFDDPNYATFFDSSAIRSQTTFSLDTSKLEPGEYEYFCTFHPFMKAKFMITGEGAETGEGVQEPAEGAEETPMPEVPTEEKSMAPNMINVEIVAGSADANNPEFYIPKEITVNIDTTVAWTNMDTMGHTVTSGTFGDADIGMLFDSNFPLMETGETFEYTFDTVGEYPYFCQVHPWMVGKVVVK
ncbi:MAG: cupredoxin domain-containing protein, partial [Nitrososphaerales archaeon]